MAKLKIFIEKGYKGGHLDLSDKGFTGAKRSDNITWQIAKGANVQSIANIDKKPGSPEIFMPDNPRRQGSHWTGDIKTNVADYSKYRYNIHWINDNGIKQIHDPIISIRPSRGIGQAEILLIAAATVLVGMFAIRYWQQKKNKIKHQEK